MLRDLFNTQKMHLNILFASALSIGSPKSY